MALNQRNPDKWGLRGVSFTLREIAAATTVGRTCGSIITRVQYTGLFDAAQSMFNLTTLSLPVWLQDITFVRTATILGADMRRIKAQFTMDDVEKSKLSGLATFVVLCSQYSEDVSDIRKMINLLLIGALGSVVGVPDVHNRPSLPYGFRPHITTFITSCQDANRDSDVYRRTVTWIAQLHMSRDISSSYAPNNKDLYSEKRRQATLDLMGELLGATPVEETMSKHIREAFQLPEKRNLEGWAMIHDTLHLTSAYIALAAAANGAKVVVQTISSDGSNFLPTLPEDPEERRATFLVRLWLVQPPEHVRGILRHSSSDHDTGMWQEMDEERGTRDLKGSGSTMFGGTLEMALCFARTLGFRGQVGADTADDDNAELLALWSRSVECAKEYRWSVRNTDACAAYLTLERPQDESFPPEALPLSKSLVASDKRLHPIARVVASLVHDYYRFADYTPFIRDGSKDQDSEGINTSYYGESQLDGAMHFVLLAMAVQVLRNTISPASDSTDIYALHTATLESVVFRGLLRDLIPSALSHQGVSSFILLQTAASIWGGLHPLTYPSSMSTIGVPDGVCGIVAPHCCVLLDLVRDPLEFARRGLSGGTLLSIWRGALPMLPRNPNTNLVQGYSETNDSLDNVSEVDEGFSPNKHRDGKLFGNMVITFEPHHKDPTRGVFCAWFGGHLVSEIRPEVVLCKLLARPFGSLQRRKLPGTLEGEEGTDLVTLSRTDLLTLRTFVITGQCMTVIIRGIDDPAWLIFAVGCARRAGRLVVHDFAADGEFHPENLTRLDPPVDVVIVNTQGVGGKGI